MQCWACRGRGESALLQELVLYQNSSTLLEMEQHTCAADTVCCGTTSTAR